METLCALFGEGMFASNAQLDPILMKKVNVLLSARLVKIMIKRMDNV